MFPWPDGCLGVRREGGKYLLVDLSAFPAPLCVLGEEALLQFPGTFLIAQMPCQRGRCKEWLQLQRSGSQGSGESSRCNLILAGGEMPMTYSCGQPSLLEWDGGSHRYKTFWWEDEGICVHVCVQVLLNLWVWPSILTGLRAGGRDQSRQPQFYVCGISSLPSATGMFLWNVGRVIKELALKYFMKF